MLRYFVFPVLRHGVLILFLAWLAVGFYYRDVICSSGGWRIEPAATGSAASVETPLHHPPAGEAASVSGPTRAVGTADSKLPRGPATAPSSKPEAAAAATRKPPAFLRVLRPREESSRPPAWQRVLPAATPEPAPPVAPPPEKKTAARAQAGDGAPQAPVAPASPPRPPETPSSVTPSRARSAPLADDGKPADLPLGSGAQNKPATESEQTWLKRARKAYWEGRKERATALYRAGLKQHPDSARLLGELGNIAFEEGRLDEAIEYLEKAEISLRAGGQQRKADNLHAIIGMIRHKLSTRDASR